LSHGHPSIFCYKKIEGFLFVELVQSKLRMRKREMASMNMSFDGKKAATVMFVDDEPWVLTALQRLFMDTEYNCIYCGSPAEALELAKKEKIWVVVSDNQMPGMTGIDFLSRLRMSSPDTIRIMMTAYANLGVAISAINRSEAFRFITKPWDNDELLSLVDEGIARYAMLTSMRSRDESHYRSLAQTVELKDPYTRGHCDRVADYAERLALAAGVGEPLLTCIRHGSILHDCGKIGVPEEILNFPGKLTLEEFEIIKQHPDWGTQVAREANLPEAVINVILYHHERVDGSGYPAGLSGEEIPIEARIAAIADVFDALTSDRPYRKGNTIGDATEVLNGLAGLLDNGLLEIFSRKVIPGLIDQCPAGEMSSLSPGHPSR
jgi:putative two-component system response regulator